jgi:hypothetical protein
MEPLKLIKYALDSTIALINSGDTPTPALEKVARELDLNPNYIQRVGEALNVALHYNHFNKTAGDNRSSDFPVADIPIITKSIFGEVEKTAAQKHSEWFCTQPEEIDYNRYLANTKFKKTAAQIENTKANFDSFDITLKGQYKKASDYIQDLERQLDELRTEKVANDAYLEAVFNATVKQFKKTAQARMSFDNFETKAYTDFGDRASGYVDLIYKAAELNEPRGIQDKKAINFDGPSRELELLGSLLKSAEKSIELKNELADAEVYVGLQKAMFKQAGYGLYAGLAQQEKTAASAFADRLDTVLEKMAGGIRDSLVTDLIGQLSDAAYDRDKPSVPFKNSKMDDLNRASLLQELIMTDPILRHQPPQRVIQAYQTMLRMAPHLAEDREVVRALLRQLTATQSIHPTEANQLIEANTNLMKQRQLMHSTNPKKENK